MSYTPTDWKTGDVITAEKLNNMESGIANVTNGYIADLLCVEFENNQDETDYSWYFQTKMTVDELWGSVPTLLVAGGFINIGLSEKHGENNEIKVVMDMFQLDTPYVEDENPQIRVLYYRSNECSLNANEHFRFGNHVATWYADLTLESN